MIILSTALCNLRDEIMASGYFNRFYEYAELIERGRDEKYPKVYLGNGQYKDIYDFDVRGSGYIRKGAPVRLNVVREENKQVTSCVGVNPILDMIVPLRLVAAVPKSLLSDNSFSDDLLACQLIGYIARKQTAVTNVTSLFGSVQSYTTDRERVWNDEVRGIDTTVDLNLSFIAIDFELTFQASLDCLNQNCIY